VQRGQADALQRLFHLVQMEARPWLLAATAREVIHFFAAMLSCGDHLFWYGILCLDETSPDLRAVRCDSSKRNTSEFHR
jgi:hypothetical protein